MKNIQIDINLLDYNKSIDSYAREMNIASNTLRRKLKKLGVYKNFLFVQEGKCANRARKKLNTVEYNKSPTICRECKKELSYDKRKSEFCSHSCSATHNNKLFHKKHPPIVISDETRVRAKDTMLKNWALGKMNRQSIKYTKLCEKCNKEFLVQKCQLKRKFCSRKCCGSEPTKKSTIICPQCNCGFEVKQFESKKRKFCGGRCRNLFNNKLMSGNRSKAELLLESTLNNKFPNMEIIFNDRTILDGLELDVYIPSLRCAIEWNGIFHIKNIRGNLNTVQKKDKLKLDKCNKLGIEIFVIEDPTSNPKFANQKIEEIVAKLNKKLSQR